MTDHYAVIGHPIRHSLSPAMQSAAFRVAGLRAAFGAIDIAPGDLGRWMREDAGDLAGFNVTIPHKQAIAALLADLTQDARTTGAVNTVVREAGTLIGHNTDVEGFDQALAALEDAGGGEALVLGAGGAARAIVLVLERRGYRTWVAARRRERAQDIVDERYIVDLTGKRIYDLVASVDLLVNATPLGMAAFPDLSPLPSGATPRADAVAIDLVYGRRTPFLETASRAGCRSQDGLEMLVRQGAAAFRIWTGRQPNIDVMRQACSSRPEEATCSAS